MKADVKFTPGKKSLKALVSASRNLVHSQFPQVPGELGVVHEGRGLKEKTREQEAGVGWGGSNRETN